MHNNRINIFSYHVEQKMCNKVDFYIPDGGHFEEIPYGRHRGLIALGAPPKIDYYDLT